MDYIFKSLRLTGLNHIRFFACNISEWCFLFILSTLSYFAFTVFFVLFTFVFCFVCFCFVCSCFLLVLFTCLFLSRISRDLETVC